MEKQRYTWEDFNKDLFLINSKICREGWFPDYIVGIKRGGLVPAVALSHFMKIPMNVITYQTRDGSKILDLTEMCTLNPESKILIVDDICDSGDTFKEVNEAVFNSYKNIRFCSLFYNIRQGFLVNYFARKIDRYKNSNWIVFPWEI